MNVMRIAYALLTYLLSPAYALYWLFRGFSERAYLDRFGQRFGFGYPKLAGGCIWIHAVSVGEVQASAPLVHALAKKFPERQLLITTVTPTGAARAAKLFAETVIHCYMPFETPHSVRNFFDATRPQLALVMETEIWPNLYYACGKRNIPLVLVSARISQSSVKNYRRLLPLFRETLSYGIVIAAQSSVDAERFRSLGTAAERTWVTGNIKFDFELDPGLKQKGIDERRRTFGERPIWVAASTHEREEEQVLAAHRLLQAHLPDALLILVPRHPERFSAVRSLLGKHRFKFVSRTDGRPGTADTEVFLGDTMGELPLFYAASDIAFVGGTLVRVGGHNLLEPAALGRPIVTGPHLFNTQQIADMFAEVGASLVVRNESELAAALRSLFADKQQAERVGIRGLEIVQSNRGALQRLMVLLEPLLSKVPD